MKRILNILKHILLYIWQLPQNLLGLILVLFYNPDKKHVLDSGVIVFYSKRMLGGISLGKYCIVNHHYYLKSITYAIAQNVVRHEAIGHTKQSQMLGWFYLPVVGLQSIIWAGLYGTVIKTSKNGYYKFWTEAWADKLAGIKRQF
jgi:hypothetical protein